MLARAMRWSDVALDPALMDMPDDMSDAARAVCIDFMTPVVKVVMVELAGSNDRYGVGMIAEEFIIVTAVRVSGS